MHVTYYPVMSFHKKKKTASFEQVFVSIFWMLPINRFSCLKFRITTLCLYLVTQYNIVFLLIHMCIFIWAIEWHIEKFIILLMCELMCFRFEILSNSNRSYNNNNSNCRIFKTSKVLLVQMIFSKVKSHLQSRQYYLMKFSVPFY